MAESLQNQHTAPRAIILLVEDEAALRTLLGRQLRNIGYQVIEAGDGIEALKVFERKVKIDLLITDLMMPRMDGHDLYLKIRENNQLLPVLLISGFISEENAELHSLSGKTRFLQKPFSLQIMVDTVMEMLAD